MLQVLVPISERLIKLIHMLIWKRPSYIFCLFVGRSKKIEI